MASKEIYLPSTQDPAIRALHARLSDLADAAERGDTAMTAFLTPREAKYARAYLAHRITSGTAMVSGGYPEAERARAILLPAYLEGLVDPVTLAAHPVTTLTDAGFDDVAARVRDALVPLRISGSGYRVLTHRDYMGALLGLGLDRTAIGDILVEDDACAVVFCGCTVAEFLVTSLKKVSTDTVRADKYPADELVIPHRRTQPIRDTVASGRLDCVVAALSDLSREKAQTAIRSGLCELDYETVEDCTREVAPPAVISLRGYGKFSVVSFDGETRKGRLRLVAEKYI